MAVDSYFYGKAVVAPLNILLYNVFTSHGPDLYGNKQRHTSLTAVTGFKCTVICILWLSVFIIALNYES